MNKSSKISLWIVGSLIVLVIFSAVLIGLSARLIHRESIKKRIQDEISRSINGHVDFQNLDIFFFPRPRIIIRQCTFSIPGTLNGTLSSLQVSLRILPLFIGRLKGARIEVNVPDVSIHLKNRSDEKEKDFRPLLSDHLENSIGSILSFLSDRAPGFVLSVKNGRMDLFGEKTADFKFEDVNARIAQARHQINLKIQCSSAFWENILIKGNISTVNFKSHGRIQLSQIHPQFIRKHLPSIFHEQIAVPKLNLNIRFDTDGLKSLQGSVDCFMPSLTIYRKKKEWPLKFKTLTGGFRLDKDKITLVLDKLQFDYPSLDLSGKLDVPILSSPTPVQIDLKLRGTNVDVHSTRKVALGLMGKSPVVQEIFKILKGGKVPAVDFATHGTSFKGLGELKNMTIQGGLLDGDVWVPGVALNLKGVEGNVTVSKGILAGRNLKARMGNSQCLGGSLNLGLEGKDAPFNLDIALEADLSQVIPVLKHVVKNEAFVKELELIDNPKGRATGRLKLGDHITSIETTVEISQFNLSAKYRRLPFPLKINSGQYFFKKNTTSVKNISGNMGTSTFTDVSYQIDWVKAPYLNITSGRAQIYLKEIYPWLISSNIISGKLQDLEEVSGIISLSSLKYRSKLFKPEKYEYQIVGKVHNMALNSPLLPGPLDVVNGTFTATSETISISDFQTCLLDAESNVSGAIKGYLHGLSNVDLVFQGEMGPDAVRWVSGICNLPSYLDLKPPIAVSNAHLTWNNCLETTFSGDLVFQEGIKISTDIHVQPDRLTINRLVVRDKISYASLELTQKNREMDFLFAGNLQKATLDHILTRNQILGGWIKGVFNAHVFPDQPLQSRMQGELQADNLVFPDTIKPRLIAENLFLVGIKNDLKVESAIFSWAHHRFDFKGNVDLSGHLPDLNLKLDTDFIDIDKLKEILKENNKEKYNPSDKKTWVYPVRGTLKLKTKNLIYGGYVWNPFQGDIVFTKTSANVSVTEANLCGIATLGNLKILPLKLKVDVNTSSKKQNLESTIHCLLDKSVKVNGNFNLKGRITVQGKYEALNHSFGGHLEFDTAEGRFYSGRFYSVMIDIFNLLQVTELLKGNFSDLRSEGFGYHSIHAKADIKKSRLILDEMVIDGISMKIVCHGYIDFFSKHMDITALAAPLKTIDIVVERIPVVNYILGDCLISIPVRIEGDLDHPKVIPISPTAVGSGLLGMVKRCIQIPVKIIEPMLPNGEPIPSDVYNN